MTSPNAADPKEVRKLEKASRLAEVQRREIVSNLMATESGRRWVLDTLDACHIFSTSFALDAIAMSFSEGERNVGLRLLNDIMFACPDQYVQMMRERNVRELTVGQRPSSQDSIGGDSQSTDELREHRDDEGNPAFDGYGQG